MNPIGVNAWVWVSPPTNESIAALAPRVKEMGFDLLELGLENPGDWDPQRMADVFAANDLSAAVCAAMGPDRDLDPWPHRQRRSGRLPRRLQPSAADPSHRGFPGPARTDRTPSP